MATLIDTTGLSGSARDEALTSLLAEAGTPALVTHVGPRSDVATRIDYWSLGSHALFCGRGPGLRMTRRPRELRASAPESIRVGFQLGGNYQLSNGSHEESNGVGHLNFTDLTQICEFTQHGHDAAAASFEVTIDQLGFTVDEVRRAGRILGSSPIYRLVQGHMARLCREVDVIEASIAAPAVGAATLELVRAMVASVGPEDAHQREVLHDSLHTRTVAYLQQHLTDPDLSVQQIAHAHFISVRQLYKVWANQERSLHEWIVAERLEGARRDLETGPQATTVTAIAQRWGFVDPTHFSRRFRQTYGLSPQRWRLLHGGRQPAAGTSSYR